MTAQMRRSVLAASVAAAPSPSSAPVESPTPSYTSIEPSPPPTPTPSPTPSNPSIDGVPLEYYGAKNGQCSNGTQAYFDPQVAKECLASLRGTDWINMPCGAMQGSCSGHISACDGVTVESRGTLWNNAQDCYDGCVSCLAIAMDNGWNSAECNIKVGLAKCTVRYDLRPGSPPSTPLPSPPPPQPTG